MENYNIIDELFEHITIRINRYSEITHNNLWKENKIPDDYDIWCITEGTVVVTIGNVNYEASKGDIIFLYPGISYTASSNSTLCSFIFTHFDFLLGRNINFLNEFSLSTLIPKDYIINEFNLYYDSFVSTLNKIPFSPLKLNGSFICLLSKVLAFCYENSRQVDRQPVKSVKNLVRLQPVLQYISNNISNPIDMGYLASLINISQKYFFSYFKITLGITPYNYIMQIKMNLAKEYLYKQNYSIKEIANVLGFSDQYSFSKVFKKYYKICPSKFLS